MLLSHFKVYQKILRYLTLEPVRVFYPTDSYRVHPGSINKPSLYERHYMKNGKFLQINKQFHIAGFLYPRIGGPYGYVSHLIYANTTEKDYWAAIARSIRYTAIHSDFSALSLKSKSQWKLSQKTIDLLTECETQFDYLKTTCFIPTFEGDGEIYTLIGEERIHTSESWTTSTWSATDTETSIEDLLFMISGFFQARLVRREVSAWRLHYILKTTWKAENPESMGYDIFVPPDSWIKEHASFMK